MLTSCRFLRLKIAILVLECLEGMWFERNVAKNKWTPELFQGGWAMTKRTLHVMREVTHHRTISG